MKKILAVALLLCLGLSAIPLTTVWLQQQKIPTNASQTTAPTTQATSEVSVTAEPTSAQEEIAVCMANAGTVERMSVRNYCIGAVAGEMPALYEEEALKAQAAACMNLARLAVQKGTSDRLFGAHISSSSTVDQAYLTEMQMRQKWGDEYNTYYARIAAAVDAVLPFAVVYEGELCQTCFHAVSPGKTENSENVWVTATPYLKAVDSSFDATADNFETKMQVHADVFADKLEQYGFVPTQTARTWLGESVYSESGTLLALEVGNISVSGAQLRSAFGLRSAAVTVVYEDGEFILTARGYGHGVGMSQYGAQQLALQGKTWQEILAHYYPGAKIVNYDNVL